MLSAVFLCFCVPATYKRIIPYAFFNYNQKTGTLAVFRLIILLCVYSPIRNQWFSPILHLGMQKQAQISCCFAGIKKPRSHRSFFPRKIPSTLLDNSGGIRYNHSCCKAMRLWRNRHTRTFEGRVVNTVRVQVSSTAPRRSKVRSTQSQGVPFRAPGFSQRSLAPPFPRKAGAFHGWGTGAGDRWGYVGKTLAQAAPLKARESLSGLLAFTCYTASGFPAILMERRKNTGGT